MTTVVETRSQVFALQLSTSIHGRAHDVYDSGGSARRAEQLDPRHLHPTPPQSFLLESDLSERWDRAGGVRHTGVVLVVVMSSLGRKPPELGRGRLVCLLVDRGVCVVAYLRQLGSNIGFLRLCSECVCVCVCNSRTPLLGVQFVIS